MEQSNDVSSTHTSETNKRFSDNELTEAKTLIFYDADRYAFINIDVDIVGKLGLTKDDLFSQEIVGDNILLRRQKEI